MPLCLDLLKIRMARQFSYNVPDFGKCGNDNVHNIDDALFSAIAKEISSQGRKDVVGFQRNHTVPIASHAPVVWDFGNDFQIEKDFIAVVVHSTLHNQSYWYITVENISDKMNTCTVHINDQEVISRLRRHDLLGPPGSMDAWLLRYLKIHEVIRDTIVNDGDVGTLPAGVNAFQSAVAGVVDTEILKMKDGVSKHVSDLQKGYSDTLEKIQSAWNLSSVSSDRTVQELNTIQERVTRMFEHMTTSYNDVTCKLDSILGKSGVTSSIKGETAQGIYINSLLREFPEAIVTDVSKTSHTCDILIDRPQNQPRVFVELKQYTQPVPSMTIKKFENDMSHHDNCGGIFVSATSAISGKTAFHIEMKASNVLVFISNTGLVDVKCIRHAIQAIDIILDMTQKDSEENEKKCAIQLDDEQCLLIANEVRTYDQRQVQIVSTLQHVISDIKAQTLSVVRKIIMDRSVANSTTGVAMEARIKEETRCLTCNASFKTTSNLTRHLKAGTCATKKNTLVIISPEDEKVAQKYFNDEMEISRGYGCVNSGLLKKHFEKWCVTTGQTVPKADTKALFNEILGPENWCADGVCGRVYTQEQLLSWTGKTDTITPTNRFNLRVHHGWRGYKLKHGISCEVKKMSTNQPDPATTDMPPVTSKELQVNDDTKPA